MAKPRSSATKRAGRAGKSRTIEPRAPYIKRAIEPLNILNQEGLELIEYNADSILQDVGMEFHDDTEILALFRQAGASVDGVRVRFDRGLCRHIIRNNAPSEFIQHARNPVNNVVIGGNNTVLCPVYGPPYVRDLKGGRRYALLEDFHNLVKLHQTIPYLHHSGGIVCEPTDIPVNKRHLDMLLGHFRYSDRACMGGLIGEMRARDSVAMAKIVFGDEFVDDNCVLYAVSNTNAPLVLDSAMSEALKVYAKHNQAVACAPFVMAGAMSPCTVAGTMTQVLAEAMATMALTQLIRPGAPVLMGSFATAISMQSGAPTFGNPESAQMLLAAGQLARRLGVPLHTVGALTAAKVADAQAAQEAAWSLQFAVLAGANFINHATGWLEGGLVTGFEKTMIDADLCGKLMEFTKGIDLSSNAQAMDAISDVGPGQHFLATPHTLANYQSAFFSGEMADNNSFEQWHSEGGQDANQRAYDLWQKHLAEYQEPVMDPAKLAALQAYVAERKASMPDRQY